jgi:hypothetical protein
MNTSEETIRLSDFSLNDLTIYKIINKYIIDNILSHYDESRQAEQENQEIHTLKIPKSRHFTLDWFRTTLLRQKSVPWEPFENSFTNHKFNLNKGILSILVRNNFTKDTDIFYYTSANELLALQDRGLTKSQALTSKVIETIGKYNSLDEKRLIDENMQFTTNKTPLKKLIVADAQKHIRWLQAIERLINNHKLKTVSEYKTGIEKLITDYIQQINEELKALKKLISVRNESGILDESSLVSLGFKDVTTTLLLKYHKDFFTDLIRDAKVKLNHAQQMLTLISKGNDCISLSDQLQSFLIFQLSSIILSSTALNNQITRDSDDSIFPGELGSYLIDADIAITNYIFDPLNFITKSHQSDYRLSGNEQDDHLAGDYGQNKILYQSKKHLGSDKKDLEKVLRGICSLNETTSGEARIEPTVVRSAAWSRFIKKIKPHKYKRFLAWLCKEILLLPLSIPNILITAITRKAIIANIMYKIERWVQNIFRLSNNYEHPFYYYRSLLGVNNLYISTLIGKMLNNVLHEFTSVIIEAPKFIYRKVTAQLHLIKNDFKTGLLRLLGFKFEQAARSEPPVIFDQQKEKFFHKLVSLGKQLNNLNDIRLFETTVNYATPRNPLDPYLPKDILSSSVNGLIAFVNFFKDTIFEKHPIIGFVAALAYVLGGSAVLTPSALLAILAKIGFTQQNAAHFISALQQIGEPLAKGELSQAIASGFTLAKATGIAIDTITQGFDSALSELITDFIQNPLLYAAGVAIAFACGHFFTDVIDVPGFTDMLREDLGTFPPLCKIMIGAKLGLISLETALPEDEEHPSVLAIFISDIFTNLMICIRLLLSPFSLSLQPLKDASHQLIKGAAIILNAINRLAVTAGQMLLMVPKNIAEVAIICYINIAKLVTIVFRACDFRKTSHAHDIPTVRTVLKIKNSVASCGYQVTFFIRDKCSRQLERFYSRQVKKLENVNEENIDYSKIIKQLRIKELQKGFYIKDRLDLEGAPLLTPFFHKKEFKKPVIENVNNDTEFFSLPQLS